MLFSILGGMVVFALGIFVFLKPDLVWKLREEWKSSSADEPSELYLKTEKIRGILFALIGIALVLGMQKLREKNEVAVRAGA